MKLIFKSQKGATYNRSLSILGITFLVTVGSYALPLANLLKTPLVETAYAVTAPISLNDVAYRNITYCPNLSANKLDIYEPTALQAGSSTVYPAVIYVHGGYWVVGDKNTNWQGIFQSFVNNKFVLVSVDYTTSTGSHPQSYPQNIKDISCAVRFLRANATKYHINSKKIGAFGNSSGGQLVSLLATISPINKYNVAQYTSYSSSVQAVGDFFGPVNLTDPSLSASLQSGILGVFGTRANEIAASATTYVINKRAEPPFLIIHGVNDELIPVAQSTKFASQLTANGNSARLVLVQNAGHELSQVTGAPPMTPTLQNVKTTIINFFTNKLY